jgi:DNA repair exonuclease SbcCD ATPase subunit
MAGGNLGDLSMTLTLKTRMEEESKKLINALNKIDVTGKRAQDALNLITEATSTLSSKGVADIKKLQDAIAQYQAFAARAEGLGVDSKTVNNITAIAEQYGKVLQILQRINATGKGHAGFSDYQNMQRVEELLQQRRHAQEQQAKREEELEKQKQERQKISAQMAQEAYRQEIAAAEQKSRAFAQALQKQMEAEEKLRRSRVGGTEFDRRRAVRASLAPEPTRYYVPFAGNMDQINEVQKAYGKAFDALGERYDRLQQKISSFHGPKDDEWLVKTKAQLAEVESQMQRLVAASERLSMQTAARLDATYKPNATTSQEQTQRRLQETNALKNAILERMEAEKREAAEAAKNEKQRQAELDKSQQKIKALKDALNRLWGERQAGKALGLDTSEADAKIRSMISALRTLREYSNMLGNKGVGWQSSLGSLNYNYFGTLAEGAKRLSSEQAKANSEKRQAIALEERHRQEVAATAARVRSDLVSAFEQARKSAGGISSAVQDLKSLFLQGGLIYGVKQFVDSIIQAGGVIDQQHIALRSILGDMQNADIMFQQIKSLALESPFTFSDLNKDVKQLAAYGVEYDDLYDTTKRLADMASGLGVSFERIALAFGQVRSRGWLDGKELRQISYAGIPLLNKLSEYYTKKEGKNVSTSDVKTRITGRGVDFEDVKQVFWEMTDAGGQFFNMQSVMSDTLLGKYNKMKDAWEIMLSDMASSETISGKFLKGTLELIAKLIQNLHTLGPAFIAAFSGFALHKANMALGGGVAAGLLSAKGKVAGDVTKEALQGKRLSDIQKSILSTKNRITNSDLRLLQVNGALTKTDLRRLYVTGKINGNMYRQQIMVNGLANGLTKAQVRAMLLNNEMRLAASGSMWGAFASRGIAAFSVLGAGIKSLGASFMAMIGGWPGLIITGISVGLTYLWSANEELKQQMKQSADELKDRYKSIVEFLQNNPINEVINKKDDKALLSAIDEYKEKLKELNPNGFESLVMKADEKKSHEDRLRYLREQIELEEKANTIAQNKIQSGDNFENIKKMFEQDKEYLQSIYSSKTAMEHSLNAADKRTNTNAYLSGMEHFKEEAEKLALEFRKIFLDIGTNPESQRAAQQMFDNMLAQVEIPKDQADFMRASWLKALGLGDDWLRGQVRSELQNLIERESSVLADKIRSGQKLNEAEQSKVKELMQEARQRLSIDYPYFESDLQRMLNNSRFTAVINLVYSNQGKPDPVTQQTNDNFYQSGMGLRVNAADLVAYKNKWQKAGQGSVYSINNAAHQDIDSALNELLAVNTAYKNGKETKKEVEKAKQNVRDLTELLYSMTGDFYTGQAKKSNKTPKDRGNKDDKELKALRDKVSLYKTYYTELQKYRKLYGADADKELMKDKNFAPIKGYGLKDRSDYGGSIRQLVGRLSRNTEERKSFVEQSIAEISSKEREEEQKRIEDVNSELSRKLDLLSEEYDLYKQLYDLTGDSQGAMQVAFQGNTVQSQSLLESLMKQIQDELDKSHPGKNAADVTSLSDNEFNKLFGEKSETLSVLVQRYKKESDKVRLDTIKNMVELIKNNRTIEQQIADLDREHESNQTKIWGSSTTTEMKKRASEGENKEWQDKRAKLEFEQFKNNTDWVTIFDDLDRVSSNTIDTMCTEIEKFSKKAGLSVEVVKQLRDALDKLRNEQIDRSPFSVMFNTIGQGNAIGDFLKRSEPGKDGKYIVSAEAGKRMGMQEGKYTKGELENEQQGKYADFSKSLQSVANKFKALESIMSPVVDLFAAFGKEDTVAGGIIQGGSDALSAAGSTAGALNNLGLKQAGPYGAAAAASISIISSFAAAHDAALEREIEASKQRQKEMENLTKNLQHAIEITLGGVYSYTMNDKTRDKLTEVLETFRKENTKFNFQTQKWEKTNKNKSRYSEQTAEQVEKSLQNKDSNFDAQLASLMVQRDELQKQRDSENKKKKKDKNAISDYDAQIEEANQQISEFAQAWAKTIYSIDLKDWASQLTDAIVEAWQKGEDAVDAYEDKVKELMNSLTKNILSQKILEVALKPTLDNLENKLKANGGKLEAEDVLSITDSLIDAEGNAIDSIVSILDSLKEKGLDLSENGSLSTSNTIKGITEETADLLASYINAIRLDVSVNRANLAIVVEAVKLLPNLNVIAQSQLTQLNTLVSLSQARNDKLDQMYDWMRSTTNGTRKLYIA